MVSLSSLAQTATVYTATIDLADMDRHVYETLDLRIARHPHVLPAGTARIAPRTATAASNAR